MTDPDEEISPPPRSRLRWLKRLAGWSVGVAAVVALVLFVSRWQVGRLGQRELNVTLTRLDTDEPDWRLEALLAERARRAAPPPDEDANKRILALADDVPKDWNAWQTELGRTDWPRPHPDNHRPGAKALAEAGKMVAPTRDLRQRALELRNMRPGAYPLVIAPNPIATLLPHIDRARRVLSVVEYEANWQALHGKPNRGIEAARAGLVVARSIGDEPCLISQLVRIACAKVAANAALQTLAWGEPNEGLAELQSELLAEADVPWFQYGMRGEREMLDRTFVGLENGTIAWQELFQAAAQSEPEPHHYVAFRAYKALLPGDRAKFLQICTEYLAASKLPHHEQLAAVKQVAIPKGPPDEFRYLVTRLLTPACARIAESGLRARADLLAGATAVACERFRRKHGRFPTELTELAPEFLPAVPLSPFDGQPLTYRVYPDRVTISCTCVGTSLAIPNPPEEFRAGPGQQATTGYRLWAVEQRGLPPEEKPGENLDP